MPVRHAETPLYAGLNHTSCSSDGHWAQTPQRVCKEDSRLPTTMFHEPPLSTGKVNAAAAAAAREAFESEYGETEKK